MIRVVIGVDGRRAFGAIKGDDILGIVYHDASYFLEGGIMSCSEAIPFRVRFTIKTSWSSILYSVRYGENKRFVQMDVLFSKCTI
mmetsp:Transcript_12236/g.18473  ORF Transcript_12236/g.18473 Transcript_12236/m.18473 type:complete len:85 (-) Transcript_12236:74-328(-)